MGGRVRPIAEADVPATAKFLHANFNERVPVEAWMRAVDVPWQVDRPNAGFMLLDGDAVVGAHVGLLLGGTIAPAQSSSASSAPGVCCPTANGEARSPKRRPASQLR